MTAADVPLTTRTYPAGAFRRMGWAFLFLGISVGPSFRLGHESFLIDVLPDFIGYLLIATAANRLVPLHRRARAARNLALFLAYWSIPTILQYTAVTSQSGGITTWQAPLWSLALVGGLLDLALVWMLCGLVADLARRAGDAATERRARGRGALYVFLKVLMAGGLALVLLAPNRELILGGALAGVLTGLVLLGLLMGLMWRAERMCQERPEVAGTPAGPADNARPGGWAFRLLALGAAVLPVALAAAAFWYYQEWADARTKARASNTGPYPEYGPVRRAFYADLLAGRIDEAYVSTTADFRTRVSRARLAGLARKYAAYVNRPPGDRGASGAGASGGMYDFLSEYEYAEVAKGRIVQVSLTIRRDRDSIFRRRPPPVKVDDFDVTERGAPGNPWPGFGQPADPGR
jgi:hypothetical protein